MLLPSIKKKSRNNGRTMAASTVMEADHFRKEVRGDVPFVNGELFFCSLFMRF